MNRRWRSLGAAISCGALVALVASPVWAAKPTKMVFDLADPTFDAGVSADVSAYCDLNIMYVSSGTVTVHVHFGNDGSFIREIHKWQEHDTYTNLDTGATITVHDVGPDIYWVGKDGDFYQAIIGRGSSSTGIIGRVVFDLSTGEVVSMAGKDVGFIFDNVCAALK
jgi:hypothetical protein